MRLCECERVFAGSKYQTRPLDFSCVASPRDLRSLCALLDTLDSAALAAQRRLTVPFIKQVIEQQRND